MPAACVVRDEIKEGIYHSAKRKAIMCDDVLSLAKSLDIKLNIPKARIQIGKQAV